MVKVKIIKIDKPDSFVGVDVDLRDKVNKECEQLRKSKSLLLPCCEIVPKMVLLYDYNDQLLRVRILSITNPTIFKCLIIDYGRIEEVPKHRLYAIPLNNLQMEPSVKFFKIPGLIPLGLKFSNEGANIKASLNKSQEWIRASYKFVGRIFQENSMVLASYLKNYSKDKVFVDVFVNYKNERENLKDLLIRENYALSVTDNIEILLSNVSLNADGDQNNDDHPNSLSGDSISNILEKSDVEDDDSVIDDTWKRDIRNLVITPENYDSLSTNRSTMGTLDEISRQILDNKVKSWFISKTVEVNSYDETVINYQYKNTIRPILSYMHDAMIAGFIKDTMVHHKTKLLLLIQSLMIPSILRGINLVAIAPHRKGKSLGMLMPILQKVATKSVSRTRSFNPLAIIICTSWKKVKELTESAHIFIGFINESNNIRKPRIVSAYAGHMEKKIMISILAGCDILITTAKCLLRLLKSHEFFKLNELEILGLDDAEILFAEHLDVIKEIFIYKQSGSYESGIGVLQVVTATNWTAGLQSFVENEMSDMFMLTVNNPLEIAVFERLNQKLIEYDESSLDLYQKIVNYLEMKESSLKRTIIFASSDRQITVIYRYLMQKVTLDLKLMMGSMSSKELEQVEKEWNQYRGYLNMPVLLISDEALGSCDVSIFNAQTLIHADINPSMFGARINFLRDQFSELSFLNKKKSANDQSVCHSYILVCPSTIDLNTANFLYKFLGRCSCHRPVWLKEKTVDYILHKEKSKVVNAICPRIKIKGECQVPACDKRHIILPDIDAPQLPNRGQIKFRLLYLVSPSNFYVRILEHTVNNESHNDNYKSQYTSLKMNILKYFSDPINIQGVNPKFIQPGFIAAIRQRDILERVMVLKRFNGSVRMEVKLMDHGSTMIVEQSDLLSLPSELQTVPAQAVEVFVTGIRPLDNDEYYHDESCKFAQEFLEGRDVYGVIMLCIGKTLWLDSVTQLVHHKTTNISVFDKSLSIEMTEKEFVERNTGHVQKLIRLCTGKIDIWNSASHSETKKPVPIMRKFSYTTEPLVFEELLIEGEDDDVVNDCTMVRVLSPNVLFLSNRDTNESIKQMQKEIKSLIDSIEIMPLRDVRVSDRILFCHNSDWLRGYVLKTESDSVSILSLDWGTLVKYTEQDYPLKRLPTEYQELPYHIIVAGLHHCNPSQPFSDDVNTVIENFVSSSEKKILLSVTAYSLEDINPDTLILDTTENLVSFHNLDICKALKRYSITIAKKVAKGDYEEMFYVLVQRLCVVPSLSWVYVVLPEAETFLNRLERSGSIPHLGGDILSTRDLEKRLKIAMNMERIISKNISFFLANGFVSSNVDAILNTLFVLVHLVYEQPVFICFYRSLTSLINFAYANKLPMNSLISTEVFSIGYISEMLYSYQSIVSHMLNHLNITVRNNKLEDGRVFLEMLKLLLVNTVFANNFFDNQSWVCVMATCIGVMQDDDRLYNQLMDMLVQLVMLCAANDSPLLAGIVKECCDVVRETGSVSVWQSSMALLSCVVHSRSYQAVFRHCGLFGALLTRTTASLTDDDAGGWTELQEAATELMFGLWRGAAVDRTDGSLATAVRALVDRAPPGHDILGRLLSEMMLDRSYSMTDDKDHEAKDSGPGAQAPDGDASDWARSSKDRRALRQLKKHRRCYKKIFEEKNDDGESSSDDDDKASGDHDEDDSDSSNAEVTSFLNSRNPADEDNVLCYDLP